MLEMEMVEQDKAGIDTRGHIHCQCLLHSGWSTRGMEPSISIIPSMDAALCLQQTTPNDDQRPNPAFPAPAPQRRQTQLCLCFVCPLASSNNCSPALPCPLWPKQHPPKRPSWPCASPLFQCGLVLVSPSAGVIMGLFNKPTHCTSLHCGATVH